MTHRDFDTAAREARREAVTFTLGGREFHSTTAVPFLPFVEALEGDDVLRGMLRAIVVDDDLPALWEILSSKTEPVSDDVVDGLVKWLIEEITGRPTPPSALSPGGASSGGDVSTGSSSATDSTSSG